MREKITMKVVADALGVSASTVSRALKGDTRIGIETRTRIIEGAERLGYRPNPMLSVLMSARRRRDGSGEVGTVALVTDYHGTKGWREKDVCNWEYEGICRRADELGYRVEEFPMSDFGGDCEGLAGALKARGIRGVLLGFTRDRKVLSGFSISDFSVAGLSTYFREVPVDRANFHGFYNVRMAMEHLSKTGKRRIGLMVPEINNRISGYLWTGAALDWQRQIPEDDRCDPFIPDKWDDINEFAKWMKEQSPDALIVYKLPAKSWLSKIGLRVPGDVSISYLFRDREEMARWPGVDGNLQEVGAAAFDLVVEGLNTNRLGVPEHPKEVLIKGFWRDPE
ncbi:LacI family DNA-binding transcriptional regulator [Luteolibacter sp. AS25]|uniref:LacI family DNA-binding transcriptional regulator n=1 Tax=Luteolibacter sp. AS25 TaxID=3135776 RepID=UPI00398B72D7